MRLKVDKRNDGTHLYRRRFNFRRTRNVINTKSKPINYTDVLVFVGSLIGLLLLILICKN